MEKKAGLKINRCIFKVFVFFIACCCIFLSINTGKLYSADNSGILICIDPGHGGSDSGAVGPTGLTEKSVDLDIALRLKNKLVGSGYKVIMTRSTDITKSMDERIAFANTGKADIFISVHNNSFVTPSANGTETYYCTTSPAPSASLASKLQKRVVEQIKAYDRGVKSANFYVLKNTKMTSALVEGVFISNPAEEQKLKDGGFRDKIATGIFNGIVDFAGKAEISQLKASFDDSGNTPKLFLPDETKSFDLKVKNNGTLVWASSGSNKVKISYHIYDKYEKVVIFEGIRTSLPKNISPGDSVTVKISIKVPSKPGSYTIEYDMVQEGITWFGDKGSPTLKKDFKIIDLKKIADFISNAHKQLIKSDMPQKDVDSWVEKLRTGGSTAADLINDLISRKEFKDLKLSNSDFIITMYNTFFNQAPKESSLDYWLSQLESGISRAAMLKKYVKSASFKNVCDGLGINTGSSINYSDDGGSGGNGDDQDDTAVEISAFVSSLYTYILGQKQPDKQSVTDWTTKLKAKTVSAGEVISNLLAKQEYKDRKLNNSDFIVAMYKAFFDLEPSAEYLAKRLAQLNGDLTRAELLDIYVTSTKFKNVCDELGIKIGSITYDDGSGGNGDDQDEATIKISAFVSSLYTYILGQKQPDKQSVTDWTTKLKAKTVSAGEVISNLLAKQEYKDRKLNNSDFIVAMYKAFFNIEPTASNLADRLKQLDSGDLTRADLLDIYVTSTKFKNVCDELGIKIGSITYDDGSIAGKTISNKTNLAEEIKVTEAQLLKLFVNRDSDKIEKATRLAKFYIKWGDKFNIRADVAWAQMCHETGFLQFGGVVPAKANNFCGLGATGAAGVYASFTSEERGVVAHFAHLAWYVYPDHLDIVNSDGIKYCSTAYDPRHLGTGHNYNGNNTLGCLNKRWAPSSSYTDKIIQFANEIYSN
jgi:N-acetylmuramoyl-L-alanine amidase